MQNEGQLSFAQTETFRDCQSLRTGTERGAEFRIRPRIEGASLSKHHVQTGLFQLTTQEKRSVVRDALCTLLQRQENSGLSDMIACTFESCVDLWSLVQATSRICVPWVAHNAQPIGSMP